MAVAVSGGSDSTALMHLVADWATGLLSPPQVSILTVDHGLRAASDSEARMVRERAGALGFDHHILRWEGPKPVSALQARARDARYRLMAGWCRAAGAGMLLTAHTLDDQAETVLMRLQRTDSPWSLAGIPIEGQWDGLRLYRPLLKVRRAWLRASLAARGEDWIDDPSNADPRFERVRARTGLEALGRAGISVERLAGLSETSARTAALLEQCARRWIGLHVAEGDAGLCHVSGNAILALPAALQQRILLLIVSHYGGGGSRPEPHELRRLAEWVRSGPVRCTLGGAVLGRRKESFWVTREAGRIARMPLRIMGEGAVVWDGRFLIEAPEGSIVTQSGDDPPDLGESIPIHARRAYPSVHRPAGSEQPVRVTFVRLSPS